MSRFAPQWPLIGRRFWGALLGMYFAAARSRSRVAMVLAGCATAADDAEVLDVDPKSFTTVWVDPDNASRYGNSVYERCGKRA